MKFLRYLWCRIKNLHLILKGLLVGTPLFFVGGVIGNQVILYLGGVIMVSGFLFEVGVMVFEDVVKDYRKWLEEEEK